MVSSRLYLDNRRPDKLGRGTLRIIITKNGTSAMKSLGIKLLPDQWKDNLVTKHPDMKRLNSFLKIRIGNIESTLTTLALDGKLAGKTASETLRLLEKELDPETARENEELESKKNFSTNGFFAFFQKHMENKSNKGTKTLYLDTLNKLKAYCKESQIDGEALSFEDIKVSWLRSFEQFCLITEAQNTASRHLRDIRAVFNSAIDDEITTNYPFRKLRIKTVETRDKSFSSDSLRTLFKYNCYSGEEKEAIDIFKLEFCLIGINNGDLAFAGKPEQGRVEYKRRKTGKHYSIYIEPEAREIINRYKGKSHLINIIERGEKYQTFFKNHSDALKKIGLKRVAGKKSEGKALFPGICYGSARTSWATIAQDELDIPEEVIAAALGHSTVKVTKTYLRTKWRRKIDKANRLVLDLVFNGVKGKWD